jgi:two-component system LytT family sensor kinase
MLRFDGRGVNYMALMYQKTAKGSSLLRILFGHPLYWAYQVFGWGCVWAISLLHVLTEPTDGHDHLPPPHSIVIFFSLACLTHLYRVFIQLNHWCKLDWRQLLPRALLASLAIATAHALLISAIFSADLARLSANEPIPQAHVAFLALGNFVLIAAWSTIYFVYHFQVAFQKMQVNQLRLQVALREAEHRALSAQINPHFLFNSLNTLRSLIDENPEKARAAVTELARLFRASLKTTHKNLITLREELETVESYLGLEQSRFETRLIVRGDIPPEALEAKLPPFLLQTLIENAIKYGIDQQAQTEISYRAQLGAAGLTLQVTNPGQIRSPRDSTTGVGLENSRLRLQLLFGTKASLSLRSLNDNFVLAEALIPQLKIAL